jgi:hypothetical protein
MAASISVLRDNSAVSSGHAEGPWSDEGTRSPVAHFTLDPARCDADDAVCEADIIHTG